MNKMNKRQNSGALGGLKSKRKSSKQRQSSKSATGDLISFPTHSTESIYTFTRVSRLSELSSAGTAVTGSYTFSLSMLDNIADFTTLFDVYRIDCAEVRFEPECVTTNSQGDIATKPVSLPYLITVIDYDDGTSISDESVLRDYQTCKITQVNDLHVRRLVPRAAIALYGGAVTNGYSESKPAIWLDLSASSTPLYGIKYYIAPGGTGVGCLWRVYVKLMISCRRVR